MKLSDLDFSYSDELVATEPQTNFRTLLSDSSRSGQFEELTEKQLLELFRPGDVLVVNDTLVEKRRVFSLGDNLEILFLDKKDSHAWSVLFPARNCKVGESLALPGGVQMKLIEKGLPQLVEVSKELPEDYFKQHGELALPPYIQKARGERHMKQDDEGWYQTAWAENAGSCASPTASLHFSSEHIDLLKQKGVKVEVVTLHVGIGTFLPIRADDLSDHQMHSEWASVSPQTISSIDQAKASGGRVWALGTTVTRTLESWAAGKLKADDLGGFSGATDLFITPGFEFQVVDVLMTNFHQPRTTLLALVSAFAGEDVVKQAYQWAVEKRFQLFSYGDFSIWIK